MTRHTPEQSLGPIMVDLQGLVLQEFEKSVLADPRVGGLILFSRNFESITQIKQLIRDSRAASATQLLIAVDHEGGRVQRFREGFTRLPPMRMLGELYDHSPATAEHYAEVIGGLLASELADIDIDFSFTPVLDLDTAGCKAIGDRAFHCDPDIVAVLATALMRGLRGAGMSAVAKHFPGHGAVTADSHVELPIDPRTLEQILEHDVKPFSVLVSNGIEGVMPAHVVYENVAAEPAGFSAYWLQTVLRQQTGFKGAIFSDDLSMQGAVESGSPLQRAELALAAGCDMLLVCNDPTAVEEVLGGLHIKPNLERSNKLAGLIRRESTLISQYRIKSSALAIDVIANLA